MNILVPHSWLKDYLQTSASANEIAQALSLCGPSVEKIRQTPHGEVFEIEVTQNRSDLLCVIGTAREASAILPEFGHKVRLNLPNIPNIPNPPKHPLPLEVKIEKDELCPRFTAIILDHVEIKPSPALIQERLETVGTRSLNNVIDVTNYLMFDLGQPMHAFDYDKISSHTMTLRESLEDEEITTLDNVKRKLPKGAIVIEDGKGRLIDLCGIMGGKNSEIDEKTKRVLLFVQEYDPVRIRKTCQTLAHRTEASARFEKGIDSQGIIPALSKAVEMLTKNANAKVASKLIDIIEAPYKPKTILCDLNKINQIIGVDITPQTTLKTLTSLGFKPIRPISLIRPIRLEVPNWRYDDINIIEDLAEEVARIYGYFKLPPTLPTSPTFLLPEDKAFYWEQKTRDYLKYQGFFECLTSSATSADSLAKTGSDPAEYLKIKNPLTKDFEYLRPTLIPQLLDVIKLNQPHFESIKIFELSNVYQPRRLEELPDEYLRLTAILKEPHLDFSKAKGVVEGLLQELGIRNFEFRKTKNPLLFEGASAELSVSSQPIGHIGLISPVILDKSQIAGEVFLIDLSFKELLNYVSNKKTYEPIPTFPPVIEDLTFEIDKERPAGAILIYLKDFVDADIKLKTAVKDIYETEDYRAITLNLSYFTKTKQPLAPEKVSRARSHLINELQSKFGVLIKSLP